MISTNQRGELSSIGDVSQLVATLGRPETETCISLSYKNKDLSLMSALKDAEQILKSNSTKVQFM